MSNPDISGVIACHYAEGIDPDRRNDLNWFWKSGVLPNEVLIYFDSLDIVTRKPVSDKTIAEIEKLGMRWVIILRPLSNLVFLYIL